MNFDEDLIKGRELPQWLVIFLVSALALIALFISTGNISWLPAKMQDSIRANFGDSPSEGIAGPQGATGEPGQSGEPGEAGQPGSTGAQGSTGPAGPAGPSGPQGATGSAGTPGEVGPQGTKGDPGEKGETGATGPAGETGATGPAGETGPMGPIGLTGEQGPQGEQGETGAIGPAGPKGDKGDQGEQGPRGLTGATGPKGDQGIQGIQGPPGGFGYYGSFYDTATHTLNADTATPVPLNTTAFANGVSIVDGYKITFANSGKYNISFSSQLLNSANARREVTIWLSKNGVAQANWVAESSTDIYLGTSVDTERSVAAWNFFVEANASDFYVLMIVADNNNVKIFGDASDNDLANLPQIPSTILTVNQVG